MLHEIRANFAVIETLPQAAESEVCVRKQRSIAVLDDQPIKERKGIGERAAICSVALLIADLGGDGDGGGDAFEINRGRVTGRVGLVIVDESAGLFLLKFKEPVCDFEDEVSECCVFCDV